MIPQHSLPTLFVLGDSISIHYGPYLQQASTGFLQYDRKQGAPGVEENNMDVATGANGGDSSMVLAYLKQRNSSAPLRSQFLLLNCGLHDIKLSLETGQPQIPLANYEKNLRAILRETDRLPTTLIWVRITPVIDEIHNTRCPSFRRTAQDVHAYNQVADQVMAAHPILDLHQFSAQFGPEAFLDHIHFTPAVRKKQGTFIAEYLHNLIKACSSDPNL